ncbi:PaaX family transcriptional regulator C-terminal domain-containing protein [Saccharomonospora sp. NPDC006951]
MPKDPQEGPPRPQALLLTFLGSHLLGSGLRIATASIVDVLRGTGVSEHATRSTLSRMARRDLLTRTRRGRNVYVGLTERSTAILRDGETRLRGSEAGADDGTWTLLGFSMPESWQRQRHALRSRLLWAGFGNIHNGLWIAPGTVDVTTLLSGIGVLQHVKAFSAAALPPTDLDALVRATWDLPRQAARYRGFLARWSAAVPPADDVLARHVLLQNDWLGTIRGDPRLPERHLPRDWPASAARRMFLRRDAEWGPAATADAARRLDTLPAPDP